MVSASSAQDFFSNIVGKGRGYSGVDGMESGMGSDMLKAAFDFAGKSGVHAGTAAGAAAGAVGGILSSDQDQSWYTGAAQGAFAGTQLARKGLSGRGVAGAVMGGLYGMAADDTSIMGGALMGGLGAGAGVRYAKHGFKAGRKAPAAYRNKKGAVTKRGVGGRVAFGMNAVQNAIKRDVGFGWRKQNPIRKNRSGGGGGGGGSRGTPKQLGAWDGVRRPKTGVFNMGPGGGGSSAPQAKSRPPARNKPQLQLPAARGPKRTSSGAIPLGEGGGPAPQAKSRPPARNQPSGSTAPAAPVAAPAAPAAPMGPKTASATYNEGVESFFNKNIDALSEIVGMSHPSHEGWQGTGKGFGSAVSQLEDAILNESPGSMLSSLKSFGNSLPRNHPMGMKTARLINETKGLSGMRGDTGFSKGKG